MSSAKALARLITTVAVAIFLAVLAPATIMPACGEMLAAVPPGMGNPNPGAAQGLHNQMLRVADWLQSYCSLNYKFPQLPDEKTYAYSQLYSLAPKNPYDDPAYHIVGTVFRATARMLPNQGLSSAQVPQSFKDRMQLKTDYSLSDYLVEQWAKSPPDSWKEPPGTITAVSNQRDMFLVWGAGADGLPIRDATGTPVLIVGHWFGTWR